MWPLRNIPIGLFSIAILSGVVLGQSYTTGNDNLTTDAISACDKIANGSAETVVWSPVAVLNTDYEQAKDHFWSAANADLTPACVVFPTTAEEVSFIVGVLLDYPSVPFAVKSGGHNSNMGFSSVNWGVLISFSKKATTTLSTDKTTADVEPGARWGEVITALEPDNVAVVGGRIGDVGVAGLLLGGGCSFLSAQYGFAADNVVNYEVVLANTSIVNVNAQEYSDLFFALRGGGGQFGIVTKFTLKTYPIGQIWGGVRTYDASLSSALLNATQQFSEENTDPKAAVIVTGELVLDSLLQVWTVFFFYNGTSPPAGVFGGFESLPTLTDSVKTRSYADFLVGNNALNVYGFRYLYRAATVPNLPAPMGKILYNDIYNNFRTYIESIDLFKPDYVFDLAFQPLSQLMASASQAAGGNIMQLDPNDGDRMWIEIDVSWLTPLGDDDAYAIIKNVSSSIESYAQNAFPGVANTRFVEGNLIEAEYNPLFLNDAMPDQNPVQTYGNGTYSKLQEIYKKYDPNLFFATRTGGFKYV